MMRCRQLVPGILFVVLAIAVLGTLSCSQPLSSSNSTLPAKAAEPTPYRSVYDVDVAQYLLTVDGLVKNRLVLTYEALKRYPTVTQTALLVCPGVFEYSAEWTGVPMATLLAEAGLEPQARQVSFHALDGYKTVLPLEEAQQEGVFLAHTVNGQALTKDDGYPLRLVAKGKGGDYWVRWLDRIEVM